MKWIVPAFVIATTTPAAADPLRLRADAFTSTAAPAGLLTLEADGEAGRTLSAEAVVWTAAMPTPGTASGDVLVIALRARTPGGGASARLGRFVETLGALRPVHVDGAAARARLPFLFDAEAYAGIPVQPGLGTARTWDWVAGGRIARRIGDFGSVGIAYAQQRDDGRLESEEFGVDAGAALGAHDDLGAKLAYDVANPGIAEASIVASHRRGALRAAAYVGYRAASHLLPATSLFSVLGDVPAERAGTTLTWRAAPRLEVGVDLGARRVDSDYAPELVGRARLWLDARGASALTGELRRDGVADSKWTGVRGAARIALPRSCVFATELELVVPDHDRGLGAAWPWGLVSFGWDYGGLWSP